MPTRSVGQQGVIRSRDAGLRVIDAWAISFLARRSPLTSGKHPPGITNDACSGPGPLHRYVACGPRLRWFWAIVPFHVGRDYAMWATITVKQKMRPTSERNPGPHHTGISSPHPMESPAHIDRNTHQLMHSLAPALSNQLSVLSILGNISGIPQPNRKSNLRCPNNRIVHRFSPQSPTEPKECLQWLRK